jgi:UDP-N-acetylglucosamine 4,6-dehydratase
MSQPTKNENATPVPSFLSPAPDLNGRSILVTGGTGSFGQQLIGRLLKDFNLARLVVFSRDEAKQYDMAQKFPEAEHKEIRYFIGDVRNVERLEMAMRGIDIVVHAAALKQVPVAEYNPFECIRTNVIGAENVVTAAIRAGVDKIVALSTDKAVNPANLYGASKLASFCGPASLFGRALWQRDRITRQCRSDVPAACRGKQSTAPHHR